MEISLVNSELSKFVPRLSIIIITLLFIFFLNISLGSGSPVPSSDKDKSDDEHKYHSWDGRFYDNVVHDSKKLAEESARSLEAMAKGDKRKLTTWEIVGIAAGGLFLALIIFCCIGYCLCACVKDMLCCFKNLVCCCCDD